MALDVTVESPSAFIGWYNAALKTPPKPTGGAALAGYALFQTRQCSSCHTIAGTEASGMVAPDLSHIASRKTIAAGTLPMDHRLMALWIADPQSVKPGNYMPKSRSPTPRSAPSPLTWRRSSDRARRTPE
jgi:cytochrome c oxidase subunit 2